MSGKGRGSGRGGGYRNTVEKSLGRDACMEICVAW